MPPGHPLHTRLCDLLGIRVPIVQTGMGWVATPELTAAASNAGAFGFLAAATIPPPEVEAAIARVRSLTDRPFGVNFLMDAPGADVITDAIIRRGVRAAGYNRSPDRKLITRLKQAGVLCIPTCGAPRHVEKAVELGADAVIVQGAEGGGHTGTIPTSLLVPACAERVDAPIIAAGGFRDGRGLVAALAWGAAGIAMGTRFLLTAESPVPSVTTDRYLEAGLGDVVVTTEIDGLPQRVIVNELLRKLEGASALAKLWLAFRNAVELRAATGASPLALLRTALAMRRNERLTRAQLVMAANAPILAKRAMLDGDPVHGYLPSGTVTGLIDDRPTCAALIERIMNEAEQTLKRLQLVQAPQNGARSEAEPSGVGQLTPPGRKETGPSSPSVPL